MYFIKRTFFLAILFSIMFSNGCGYNSLQGQDEDVKAAWAEVQNQYQRRHDLVPNLVEVVKGYAKHERETLEAVIAARAKATGAQIRTDDLSNPQAFKNFQSAQTALSQALSRLLVVIERYPDLKASSSYRDLQAQLEGTENRITVARKRYIDAVAIYNKGVRYFPTNLTAKFLLHLKERETFTVTEAVQEVPKVQF
jgi:LemA protein